VLTPVSFPFLGDMESVDIGEHKSICKDIPFQGNIVNYSNEFDNVSINKWIFKLYNRLSKLFMGKKIINYYIIPSYVDFKLFELSKDEIYSKIVNDLDFNLIDDASL
jgi:hypothetical protein